MVNLKKITKNEKARTVVKFLKMNVGDRCGGDSSQIIYRQ